MITAYDGYSKAVLPAFNILVQAASSNPIGSPPGGSGSGAPATANGSATLSWMPTYAEHQRGRPDQASRATTSTTARLRNSGRASLLANAGLTRYVLTGLTQATWYFAMTAYDSAGRESDRTAVAALLPNNGVTQ